MGVAGWMEKQNFVRNKIWRAACARESHREEAEPGFTGLWEITMVERRRIELPTSALRTQRSPS